MELIGATVIRINFFASGRPTGFPGKRPQTVCVRSRDVYSSRKSRDLDALGYREVSE